jgi:hypothetical protein
MSVLGSTDRETSRQTQTPGAPSLGVRLRADRSQSNAVEICGAVFLAC